MERCLEGLKNREPLCNDGIEMMASLRSPQHSTVRHAQAGGIALTDLLIARCQQRIPTDYMIDAEVLLRRQAPAFHSQQQV